jgi:hypothetical protein
MLDPSFTNQTPDGEAGSLGNGLADTCGDPRKTRFFFPELPPATEMDLAAQQKKRRSSGWEYRAMVVAPGWDGRNGATGSDSREGNRVTG